MQSPRNSQSIIAYHWNLPPLYIQFLCSPPQFIQQLDALIIDMEKENVTKSIIYGNNYQNRYANFLPLCSSILDRASIEDILAYLKESVHFRKFNRIAYAYRVDEMPVVFITEKKNVETQYFEGHHSDETIEGSGEKLLHLLEKFNIRNVLIAVLIQQFNPLLPFETTNYRAIVENSRILLDQLYRRVIQFQEQTTQSPNDLLLCTEKLVKTKKVQIGHELQLPNPKQQVPRDRPNYVYNGKMSKPAFSTKKLPQKAQSTGSQQEMSFLWERCQTMKDQYVKVVSSLTDKELEQLKYFIMYDKNPIVNMVILMFSIYSDATRQQLLEEFDFSSVRQVELEALPRDKQKKLDHILKTNKKLTVDTVIKINRALGMLFSMMEIRIRFSKCVLRITELLEKVERSSKMESLPSGGLSATPSNELSRMVRIDPTI